MKQGYGGGSGIKLLHIFVRLAYKTCHKHDDIGSCCLLASSKAVLRKFGRCSRYRITGIGVSIWWESQFLRRMISDGSEWVISNHPLLLRSHVGPLPSSFNMSISITLRTDRAGAGESSTKKKALGGMIMLFSHLSYEVAASLHIMGLRLRALFNTFVSLCLRLAVWGERSREKIFLKKTKTIKIVKEVAAEVGLLSDMVRPWRGIDSYLLSADLSGQINRET